jgi:hypothetical protein
VPTRHSGPIAPLFLSSPKLFVQATLRFAESNVAYRGGESRADVVICSVAFMWLLAPQIYLIPPDR